MSSLKFHHIFLGTLISPVTEGSFFEDIESLKWLTLLRYLNFLIFAKKIKILKLGLFGARKGLHNASQAKTFCQIFVIFISFFISEI